MRVAINTLPLATAHRVRGVGYYTEHLLQGMKDESSIEVIEFTKSADLKRTKIDLVHYPWFDFFFHTLPIKKPFPTVVTIHDAIPLVFKERYPLGIKGKINFILQKISLMGCRFFITDSLASKKDIIKHLSVRSDKIEVIPLAADKSFRVLGEIKLIQTRRKYNLPSRFLLYVGDANWVKNLPFLVESFRQICQEPNLADVKLVLVGGVFLKKVEDIDHPELESLKDVNRKIKEYGLEDRVIRPGNVNGEDLVAFFNLATVYIQPSLYEGFGLPLLQAFSCGTPVVSSDRGSLPEVGGNAAIYFNPSNVNQFKIILEEVLEDKALRNKLSKLGMEQAERFSWEKVIEDTQAVYKKVIGNVK